MDLTTGQNLIKQKISISTEITKEFVNIKTK